MGSRVLIRLAWLSDDVCFRANVFVATFSKLAGRRCYGVNNKNADVFFIFFNEYPCFCGFF